MLQVNGFPYRSTVSTVIWITSLHVIIISYSSRFTDRILKKKKLAFTIVFRSLLFLVVNTWNLFDSIAQSFVPYHIQHNESTTNLMSKKVWKWLSNVRNKSPEKHIKKFWYFLALIWAFKTRLNFWRRFSYRDYDALCVYWKQSFKSFPLINAALQKLVLIRNLSIV